jgi:aromatic-L-amino-acid decarboxylase
MSTSEPSATREAVLEMSPEQFRDAGHRVVDLVADFLATIRDRPVTTGETPLEIRRHLQADRELPETGSEPRALLEEAAELLFNHSLFNNHPRFWGFITSSASPLGTLGDLLAAAVNPNCGAWVLSPMASEIEAQTVRWIATLLGYPASCGGLLVSGGNQANFVCFLAARQAKAGWDVRSAGFGPAAPSLRVYSSKETHTWIQKAADLFGLGTDSVRWIPTDRRQRMRVDALRDAIAADRARGDRPFLVVGTAGSVSTGAIDPLLELSELCQKEDLWFHVDGAYGGFAAALPDAPADLKALTLADSVAIDPHKWLYAPLEAGCALVRDPERLRAAFSYHPDYYHFGIAATNYVDYGPQNSRGFRALKVWLALRHAGRQGYVQMISDDIRLANELAEAVRVCEGLELKTKDLSIVTFRYVPPDLADQAAVEAYLNDLNREVLTRLQQRGEYFLSNAVLDDQFLLRACIVNFRTTSADVQAAPGTVVRYGKEVDQELRPAELRRSLTAT